MAERRKQPKKSVAFQSTDVKGDKKGLNTDRNLPKEKKSHKKEHYLDTDEGSLLAQDLARLENAIREERSISLGMTGTESIGTIVEGLIEGEIENHRGSVSRGSVARTSNLYGSERPESRLSEPRTRE